MNSIKVVLLGESSVGKTSLVVRLKRDIFADDNESTVGVSFSRIPYNSINFELWDTAGQQRFFSLLPMYYRSARIVLLVFDVSNLRTLDRIYDFFNKISLDIKNDYKVIIIGNKTDLVDDLEPVKRAAVEKFKDYSIHEYVYVSAKSNSNVDMIMPLLDACAKLVKIEVPVCTLVTYKEESKCGC